VEIADSTKKSIALVILLLLAGLLGFCAHSLTSSPVVTAAVDVVTGWHAPLPLAKEQAKLSCPVAKVSGNQVTTKTVTTKPDGTKVVTDTTQVQGSTSYVPPPVPLGKWSLGVKYIADLTNPLTYSRQYEAELGRRLVGGLWFDIGYLSIGNQLTLGVRYEL
jgi:hypothetical protein